MKKILSLLLVVVMAVLCLVSCGEEEKTVYQILDELAAKELNKVTVDVETVVGAETLAAEYKVVKKGDAYEAKYSYEVLNTFEGETVPTEKKSVKTGSLTFKDGKVTKQDGEAADLAVTQLGTAHLNFAEANFEGVEATEGKFTAKVKDASAFLGQEVTVTDATVEVVYGSALEIVVITYKTASAAVTLTYTF